MTERSADLKNPAGVVRGKKHSNQVCLLVEYPATWCNLGGLLNSSGERTMFCTKTEGGSMQVSRAICEQISIRLSPSRAVLTEALAQQYRQLDRLIERHPSVWMGELFKRAASDKDFRR